VAADLTHPALAAPLATGISGVSAFLVQDYVAADSLDLAVREYGPAPPGSALLVAAQLAGALDFAAAVQITHGVLHPRDVLLSSDDTRLTGLGVTRALERIGVVAPVRRPYTAPERIAGGEWDRRADVFSLAAVMHELLWGRRVSGLGARAVESLTEIPGTRLRALREVFARALAEKPADRYETALEFAEALKNACPDVVVAPEPAPPAKRRPTREEEPRLPLDDHALPLRQLDNGAAATGADDVHVVEPEISPSAIAEPEIAYQPGPAVRHEPALSESAAASIAIGFAGGFFAGSREQPTTAVVAAVAPPPVPVPAAKEPTGAAAAAPAPSTPAPTKPEVRSQKSEVEAQKAEAKKAEAAEGRILVRSRPAGARVAVDGKDYGPTPAAVRGLSHGAHRVRIVHDGYVTEERRFVVTASRPAQSMTVDLAPVRAAASARAQAPVATQGRFVGALAVDSRPAGAKVFMDGALVGTTPMALPSVPAGSHAIRLEHDGYRRWSSSVRIVASEQNRVTASLER
jgi:hypothetical protein